MLLCPRQTPCAQYPPLLRCSTRPAPRTLTEAHTSSHREPSETHLRMSVDKTCGKSVVQYTGKQPDEGSVVTSRDTTALLAELQALHHTHRKKKRGKNSTLCLCIPNMYDTVATSPQDVSGRCLCSSTSYKVFISYLLHSTQLTEDV